MGQTEHAKHAYLDVLTRCPGHLGALNNLGTLLCFTGYRTAARTAYGEAIRAASRSADGACQSGESFPGVWRTSGGA